MLRRLLLVLLILSRVGYSATALADDCGDRPGGVPPQVATVAADLGHVDSAMDCDHGCHASAHLTAIPIGACLGSEPGAAVQVAVATSPSVSIRLAPDPRPPRA